MNRVASIDIGSNTLRLLVLEGNAGGPFRELAADRAITRLGEGMDTQKRLLDSRIQLTLEALGRFKETCRSLGAGTIHAVATSAVREAANREEFVTRVRDRLGIEVEVIPWEEEARLTLEGVFWKLPDHGQKTLTFDIGGGSTEFILSRGKNIAATAGTSLGVVRLTEKFISRHPVPDAEHRNLSSHLAAELKIVKNQLGAFNPDLLIGTAGTVTTLAALDGDIFPYDPAKIHGYVLPFNRVQAIMERLKSKTLEERLALRALERGREDLIIAGTALVLTTMETFACPSLTVSEYSLREGILLKALGQVDPERAPERPSGE